MNEWYTRDTSRKIQSTFRSKGESGKHTASSPPYGYIKDEKDKDKWIVDEKAAEIVRRIFNLTMQGNGPYRIAKILESEKVDIPAYHQQKLGYGLHQSKVFEHPYRWCSSTIVSILKKQEYLGHTVNFKTRKHFKDKKSKYVSEENWLIFENTHEAIIDQETFAKDKRKCKKVSRWLGRISPFNWALCIMQIVAVKCMFIEQVITKIFPTTLAVLTRKYPVERFVHLLTG